METMNTYTPLTRLALVAALCCAGFAQAQVAGSSTMLGVSITENTQLAMGWSVSKTLLGKAVFNALGQRIGKVEDLIMAPDHRVSYAIIGTGGFVGIGRHDVAVPLDQLQDSSGKLVLSGASKDSLKALPSFDYASDTSRRDAFIAAADKDVAEGKAGMAALEKKAANASAEAKVTLSQQRSALEADVQAAEFKLTQLKTAGAKRWREFAGDVSAATQRLRKSLQSATS
jgi:sporulation protein YlmC with PRC-barrel domain